MALRHGGPDVDRAARRGHVHADLGQRGAHEVAAARVDLGHLRWWAGIQRLGGRKLHGLEHPRVDVGLQLPVGLHGLGVAHHRGGAPAGHVPALGEREHLDAHVPRARGLQEAGSHVAVEGGLGVGGVVHHEHVVLAGELHRRLEEALRHHRAGRVVRVVEEHQPGAPAVLGRDRVEVGREAALGQQGHHHGLAAGHQRDRPCTRGSRDRRRGWRHRGRGRPG